MLKNIKIFACAMCMMVFGVTVQASVIVSPISATGSSNLPVPSIPLPTDLAFVINQSGMFNGFNSGVTNFDTFVTSGALHTGGIRDNGGLNSWFGSTGLTTDLSSNGYFITFDLGSILSIGRVAL